MAVWVQFSENAPQFGSRIPLTSELCEPDKVVPKIGAAVYATTMCDEWRSTDKRVNVYRPEVVDDCASTHPFAPSP